jgi:protein-tyrosine phosphatase
MAGLYWRYMGAGIGNPQIPRSTGSVLFLCQGNVCRSPFAERYFRKIAGDRILRGIRSQSAGLDVRVSVPPPDLAVNVAKTLDVDLADHRSKPVTADMIEESDMIFVMEHRQAAFLRRTFPGQDPKIFLLPMFDTEPLPAWDYARRFNISDPYGKSAKDFVECFRKIESSIDGFLSRSDLHPSP